MDFGSEQELIEGLQRGSQRAFAAVYQQFSEGVFAYCLKILADRQLAKDVVQEAFLKVQQHARLIQHNESFTSWIFRIAGNEALMRLRKRRMDGRLDDNSVWSEETPHEQLVALERSEIVNRLLDSLKREYREYPYYQSGEQIAGELLFGDYRIPVTSKGWMYAVDRYSAFALPDVCVHRGEWWRVGMRVGGPVGIRAFQITTFVGSKRETEAPRSPAKKPVVAWERGTDIAVLIDTSDV